VPRAAVARKTRTVAASEAVAQSLAALQWFRRHGTRQIYFKYCSTFHSTPAGNIGPVTDALMDALGTGFTIACPSFPENGRTVFNGHLFVGNVLLQESGMRHHPLTPMTDSNDGPAAAGADRAEGGAHRPCDRAAGARRHRCAHRSAGGAGQFHRRRGRDHRWRPALHRDRCCARQPGSTWWRRRSTGACPDHAPP
jgi:hypothetical protein